MSCRGTFVPTSGTPPPLLFFAHLGVCRVASVTFLYFPLTAVKLHFFNSFLNMLSQKQHQHHWPAQLSPVMSLFWRQLELVPSNIGTAPRLFLEEASPAVPTSPKPCAVNQIKWPQSVICLPLERNMQDRWKRKPTIKSLTLVTLKFCLRRMPGSMLKTRLTEIMLPSWGRLKKVQITAKCFPCKTRLGWSFDQFINIFGKKKIHYQCCSFECF